MYMGLLLNGIRTIEPINLDSLNCFEITLKCSYGECKRHLYRIFIGLLLDGELATYELIKQSKEKCLVRIYLKNANIINRLKSELTNILDKNNITVRDKHPSYNAIENFFDLLVGAAFKKSNFKYIPGKGKVLDPSDFSKYIKKRTIIEVRQDNSGKEKYHGILFIDYSTISRSSLADKLLEELGIDDFQELKEDKELKEKCIAIANSYIGKSVLTMIKRRGRYEYVHGEITGIETIFSCEKTLPNGHTLYELWTKRFKDEDVRRFAETEPNMWEFPLFKVKLKGATGELTYPPSMLRIFETIERPDPSTRWDNIRRIMRIIEENIKKIYKNVTGKNIKFKYIKYTLLSDKVGIKPNFYTGSITEKPYREYTVKLKYVDSEGREKRSLASPLFMFSNNHAVPYAGKRELDLLVIYQSTINWNIVNKFVNYLQSLFQKLNFGNLNLKTSEKYNYIPTNLSKSLASLENTLRNTLQSYNNSKQLPLIIIPDNESFYKLSKEIASNYEFHSQLIRLDTLNNIIELLSKMENHKVSQGTKKKLERIISSLLANICGGIYVEFLIQKSISEGKISGPLTWILASPADKNDQSMYVGLDISTKRGVSGAAFILLNPYGELIDARLIQLKSETLQYMDYYDILLYMISRAKNMGLKRIVILRDGFPRTTQELKDCIDAFTRITTELDHPITLDYISVIKRTSVRLFASNKTNKANPLQGTYTYMYQLKHLGYPAHEILMVASKPEENEEEKEGTVRPIILRIYELQKSYNIYEIKRIAEEYLALTRLNYWNLTTGASKLALPVKMAETLSYMLSMGIPIKVK